MVSANSDSLTPFFHAYIQWRSIGDTESILKIIVESAIIVFEEPRKEPDY